MKYYGIEYLRFILALSVMLFHALGYFNYKVPFLSLGVDIFFVISGVVFVLSTYNNKNPITFMYKRIKRVYPLYIIVTLLTILSYFVVGKSYEVSILRDFFMFPSFYEDGSIHMPLLYQAWTLQYEILFYLICCSFMCFCRNNKIYIYILLSLLLISLISLYLAILNIDVVGITSFIFTDKILFLEFAFGMAIGLMFEIIDIKLSNKNGIAIILLSLLLLYSTSLINPELYYRGLYFGFSSMLMVFAFMLLNIKNTKLAILLGSLSYPIYLGHQLVNYTLSTLLGSYVFGHSLKIYFLILIQMIFSIIFAYILLKVENLGMKNLSKLRVAIFKFKNYR